MCELSIAHPSHTIHSDTIIAFFQYSISVTGDSFAISFDHFHSVCIGFVWIEKFSLNPSLSKPVESGLDEQRS
jgi:hypothetical protein